MKELKLFGMRMKQLRTVRNLSQEQLAEGGGRRTITAGCKSAEGTDEMMVRFMHCLKIAVGDAQRCLTRVSSDYRLFLLPPNPDNSLNLGLSAGQ